MIVYLIAALFLAVLIAPVLVTGWLDDHGWSRRAHWTCPSCARPFGLQKPARYWSLDSHQPWWSTLPLFYGWRPSGPPRSGPLLSCAHCQRSFRFDAHGKLVAPDDAPEEPAGA